MLNVNEQKCVDGVIEEIKSELGRLLKLSLIPNYMLADCQIRHEELRSIDIIKHNLPQEHERLHKIVGFGTDGIIRTSKSGKELSENDFFTEPYLIYLNFWVFTNCEDTKRKMVEIFDKTQELTVENIASSISCGKKAKMTKEEISSKVKELFAEKFASPPSGKVLYKKIGPYRVEPPEGEKEFGIIAASIEKNMKESEKIMAEMNESSKQETGPVITSPVTTNSANAKNMLTLDDTILIASNGLVRVLQEALVPRYIKSKEAIGGCSPKDRDGNIVAVTMYGMDESGKSGGDYADSSGRIIAHFNLYFMVSVSADREKIENKFEAETRIIGKIAQVLRGVRMIPAKYLEIPEMQVPLVMKKMEDEERAKVWQLFSEPYKPSLFYIMADVPVYVEDPVMSRYEQSRIQKRTDAAQRPRYEYDGEYGDDYE